MKRFLALLVVLLALGGCSGAPAHGLDDPHSPPTVAILDLHGDVDFTPEERFILSKATDTWSLQTGAQARITVTYDLDFKNEDVLETAEKNGWHTLVRATEEDWSVANRPGVLGWATTGGIHSGQRVTIVLVVDRSGDFLPQVATHELGHGLGLGHLPTDRNSIMYPSVHTMGHVCLKRADLSEFCRVNICERPTYPCE